MLTLSQKIYNLIKKPNRPKLIVWFFNNTYKLLVIEFSKHNLDYNILFNKSYNLELNLKNLNIIKLLEKIKKLNYNFNISNSGNLIIFNNDTIIEKTTNNQNLRLDCQYIYQYYNIDNLDLESDLYYQVGIDYILNLKLSLINSYTNNFFTNITTKNMILLYLYPNKNLDFLKLKSKNITLKEIQKYINLI